jgi:sn-glycerol 3-phosphate transport system permease protein
MQKRVVFNNRLLPYLLLAPQIVVTMLFFFWPAGQAIYQSAYIPDPFGLSTQFVGWGNFEFLLAIPIISRPSRRRWCSPRW